MVFKNRDDALQADMESGQLTIEDATRILLEQNKISEPTRTVVGYVTDIAAVLRKYQLDGQYGVFGGYAVLAHLVSRFGDSVIPAWRGSNDIDMFGTIEVLNALRATYIVTNDRPSPNLDDKVTLKIVVKSSDEIECKIDYLLPKGSRPYQIEEIPVLGVPIVVATPIDLIKAKMGAAATERKQMLDIESLLGVIEYRQLKPKQVAAEFSRPQAQELYNLIVRTNDFNAVRLTTGPSPGYLNNLKHCLKDKF